MDHDLGFMGCGIILVSARMLPFTQKISPGSYIKEFHTLGQIPHLEVWEEDRNHLVQVRGYFSR